MWVETGIVADDDRRERFALGEHPLLNHEGVMDGFEFGLLVYFEALICEKPPDDFRKLDVGICVEFLAARGCTSV